jgi:hypothetical protein
LWIAEGRVGLEQERERLIARRGAAAIRMQALRPLPESGPDVVGGGGALDAKRAIVTPRIARHGHARHLRRLGTPPELVTPSL